MSNQIWMRCFTPVDVKHRGKLWGGLAPPPLHTQDPDVYDAGRWHRHLVCGLVTLFAQVCWGLWCRVVVWCCEAVMLWRPALPCCMLSSSTTAANRSLVLLFSCMLYGP